MTTESKVKPIPEGYHSLTPYLIVHDARHAIDFYKEAFGATELYRFDAPDGKIAHAELQIGNSRFMLADESPEMLAVSPQRLGGSPVGLLIYVENVDVVYPKAIAAGGKELRPLQNQFYGDRSGTLQDPFGHKWTVSTHIEDVSAEETKKRASSGTS